MAHLYLGLLAYWVVNTIRYQLKKEEQIQGTEDLADNNKQGLEKINFQWCEIASIMNAQKIVLTVSQNRYDQVIISYGEPNAKVQAIFDSLNYKNKPFVKRKYVVCKMDFEKFDLVELQRLLI